MDDETPQPSRGSRGVRLDILEIWAERGGRLDILEIWKGPGIDSKVNKIKPDPSWIKIPCALQY